MDNNATTDLTVLFSTPAGQLRYLERLEARYYSEFMDSTPRTFEAARQRLDAVEAAIRNFSPEKHTAALRARNMTT